MEFTTIILEHKKSEIEIESLKKYDIYTDISIIAKNYNIFKIHKGKKFYDLIGLTDPWNIVISEKLKSLLEQNNIKGWTCYPITIQHIELKYYIFEVIGRAGIIRDYDEDGNRIYGTSKVEISTWDNSDIFHIGETKIIVCTYELKNLIESARITNIEFEDLSKY